MQNHLEAYLPGPSHEFSRRRRLQTAKVQPSGGLREVGMRCPRVEHGQDRVDVDAPMSHSDQMESHVGGDVYSEDS